MKTIDFTPLLQAVIAVAAALITYRVVPYIKAHTTDKQYSVLTTAAKVAVGAAEQIYHHGDNDKKYSYAMNRVQEFLLNEGIKADYEAIRDAVEAAVNEMKTEILPELTSASDIPPLEEWNLDTLSEFCKLNDIPHEGCVTKDDFVNAIVAGSLPEE